VHGGSRRLTQALGPVLKRTTKLICFAFLVGSGCSASVAVTVDVRNACNTFVSESAPRHTPELRTGKSGLELIVSFTPAEDREARAIFDAARSGADLIVYPSAERVHALGLESGHLVLQVASAAQAEHVKELLCFKPHGAGP